MANPMNNDDYSSHDGQITDLKELVGSLMTAMATAVVDLSSEARGSLAVSHDLLGVLDKIDPRRELLREADPGNPLCDNAGD